MTAYLIGIDEAGFGPNLGPLLVAGSLWEVPSELLHDEDLLDQRLAPNVVRDSVRNDASRLAIADSKKLYRPGTGLGELERGVFAALANTERIDQPPATWRKLWSALRAASDALEQLPWYSDYDADLPTASNGTTAQSAEEQLATDQLLRDALSKAGVRLLDVRARAVFPSEFNRLIETLGNKSSLLSEVSLDLVEQLAPAEFDELLIHCDKHGGRKRYGPLLQSRTPDQLVTVKKEAQAESIYRWPMGAQTATIRFVVKGDHFLPAALASMFAKYLREQAMGAFTDYWTTKLPGIRPTAGYPQDAKRFRAEVERAMAELDLAPIVWWRNR